MTQRKRVAIIPDLTSEYDREVVKGFSRYVHEQVPWTIYLHDDPHHKIAQLERWHGHGVIANIDDPKVVQAVKKLRIPVIGYGGVPLDDEQIHFVAGSNEVIARLAVEHLMERGFTNFAFCGWPPTPINPWSLARGQFFKQFVCEAGFHCAVYPARRGTTHWASLVEDLSAWLEALDKPVGLMAANDARARQILEACREINLAVPDEVAVIGVDNNEMICNLSIPPLSSIIHGGAQVGYEAAALLQRLMSGHALPTGNQPVVPPAGIVTRQSTDTLAIKEEDVAAAVRFIRDHAARPLQVRDVVNQVNVSRATLEKRFKLLVGRTIHSEIRRVQIRQVQQLLRTTDLPLHKIADRTGFRYEQYLAAVFRKACGQTPGQYRANLNK